MSFRLPGFLVESFLLLPVSFVWACSSLVGGNALFFPQFNFTNYASAERKINVVSWSVNLVDDFTFSQRIASME